MIYNPDKHHRKSIRLKGFDYSQDGAYFVTICTYQHAYLFGEIVDGDMQLNDVGGIVHDAWIWLAIQYDFVNLREWVIMPNHLHGIIEINGDCRGGSRTAPTVDVKRKSLGRLVGAFKTVSTKRVNQLNNTPGMKLWQRNYWEHIIRNTESYEKITEYIKYNPQNWETDKLNAMFAK